MPSPGPRPQDVDASPRLDCSLILPSVPTGRVPAPSDGSGRTSSSWFSAPVLVATNVTGPLATLSGTEASETIIAEPPPIMAPPRSERLTITTDPDVAFGSQPETVSD